MFEYGGVLYHLTGEVSHRGTGSYFIVLMSLFWQCKNLLKKVPKNVSNVNSLGISFVCLATTVLTV